MQPCYATGSAAVPTVLIDAHGGLVPDPQAWLYRSLSVTDDGLLPQRFNLPALLYSMDGTALPVGVCTGLVDAYGFRRNDGALATGAAPGGTDTQRPQRLVISTSSFMDLPEGAKFQWVEIEARSLAEHRAYLQQLVEAMRRDALIPAGGHGPARTELEV
jgi:hypothetical protein